MKKQGLYFPFGLGPRIRNGQTLTIIEEKMATAMILQCFSFELSPFYMHAPHMVQTLQPRHEAHLILHRIYHREVTSRIKQKLVIYIAPFFS